MKANYEKAVKLIEKYKNVETSLKNATPEAAKIITKITARKSNQVPTVKEFCDQLIKNKLTLIAKSLPDEGYSMGSMVVVKFGNLKSVDDRTKEYSNSCKWRETYGRVEVIVTKTALINTKVIGGLVTYIFPSKSKVKKCWWYEGKGKKQNFELVQVFGYIYNGYHATTKEKAFEGGKRIEDAKKEVARSEKNYNKALRYQYSFDDSIKAGNCEVGTKAFVLRAGLDIEKKYRGVYLLKMAKEKSTSSVNYVKRMIEYKAKG